MHNILLFHCLSLLEADTFVHDIISQCRIVTDALQLPQVHCLLLIIVTHTGRDM